MAGNSFGELFRITTFGESHGPAIGVVIDGVPPNISLKEKVNMRTAAYMLAIDRVAEAKRLRGIFP